MREIKFRARVLSDNEWVYGYYVLLALDARIYFRSGIWVEVDPKTVGQFTGLKDKNGVEIYEGDIIRWFGFVVSGGKQVRPERILAVNDFIEDAHRLICITEGTGQTIEVIGNIYENKELIDER